MGDAWRAGNKKTMESHQPISAETDKPTTVVYACSGGSDAGELADRIARRLAREGAAEMSCLAGIGGRVKSLMAKAENAKRILAIDGCPLNCTRHTLELAGFRNFDHLELHQLGFRKNSCPVTDACVETGVNAAKKILLETVDADGSGTGFLAPISPPISEPTTTAKT